MFIGVLAVVLSLPVWRYIRGLPTHPQFGSIYQTSAYDLNEARSNPVGAFLRSHLPRRIVQSPRFPDRYKDQPGYLDLAGHALEWSIRGTNTGWLYFWEAGGGKQSAWEFAPCAETNLLSVHGVATQFFGPTNPQTKEVFGDRSTTNAIPVSVGQVLFARRKGGVEAVYVVQLEEQRENRLIVNYFVAMP